MARYGESSSSRPTWQGSKTRRRAKESNRIGRWPWVAFTVLLLVFTFYVIVSIFQTRPKTYVALLVPTQNRSDPDLPLLPYAMEDLRGILQQEPSSPTKVVNSFDAQSSLQLANLPETLRSIPSDDRDRVVIYIRAQGIVRGGEAYLVDQQNEGVRDNPELSGKRLAWILEQITEQKVSAETILLVLDAGNIVADAGLGVPFNYFSQAAQQAVQTHEDRRIWVMLSHSSGQMAYVLPRHQRSVFGNAFALGLSGDADNVDRPTENHHPDGDQWVTLRELYSYVLDESQRLTEGGQTPLILRCGQTNQLAWRDLDLRLARAGQPAAPTDANGDQVAAANRTSPR